MLTELKVHHGRFKQATSFSAALMEQMWHKLLSLEIEIVDHQLVSMASLWFEVW